MGEVALVDAFTDRTFSGNPCCVVLLDAPVDDADWMQAMAREWNQPATAFVAPRGDGGYALRWFSPAAELTLCGHGTLSSAHVLFERHPRAEAFAFQTREAGELIGRKRGDRVELDLPALPTAPADAPAALVQALGQQPRHVERGRFDFIVELESEHAVRDLRPDFELMRRLDTRGVIVTACANDPTSGGGDADFVSRFFALAVGALEDAVTGSAHCALGPYWAARLGRNVLVGVQLSERRGVVHVTVESNGRVTLGGQAVTVMRGRLASDPLDEWYSGLSRLVAAFPETDLKWTEPPLISSPGPARK